jgi:putative N6-adenine-specific DNA methylase
MEKFEIFLAAPPGLEPVLRSEAQEQGFAKPTCVPGGVTIRGTWREVWRANLVLRGAGRVLARIGSFRAMHMSQLDKRARQFDWAALLRPDVPVRVEVSCKGSKIYHDRAARQRIETAISDTLGAPIAEDAPVRVMVRIENNVVTLSLDTSGELLHKRGTKAAVGKAPMRETLAALFLRSCGYNGREPVVDPMCGSGTFLLEAAGIAAGLQPGAHRSFAFEHLANFDPEAVADLRRTTPIRDIAEPRFFGSDRNDGAIRNATENAARAGLDAACQFTRLAVSDLQRPEGAPGLVIVNPPYGARIGDRKLLFSLYGSLGEVLRTRFAGWRVGIVTSDGGLAKATGLAFGDISPPIPHGGLQVKLYQAGPL